MKRALLLAAVTICIGSGVQARSPLDIQTDNTRSIVFLRHLDESGKEVMSGTGLIVSHDGYVLTANHLSPGPGETLVAVIGQRIGTVYPLEFRDKDEQRDLALWQLPQASSCRASAVLSKLPLDESQNLVAIGFPADRGLSRAILHITNMHSPLGFYASDGALEEGYSGGPVFNESGDVVGLVQGGTISGARSNDIVPIAAGVAMIVKLGLNASIGESQPYPDACYSSCRVPENGLEKWTHEEDWSDHSGRMNGGFGEASMCAGMAAAKLASSPPGSHVDVDRTWETSDKDILGHVTYVYYCSGKLRSGPIYKEKRSPACPLWE